MMPSLPDIVLLIAGEITRKLEDEQGLPISQLQSAIRSSEKVMKVERELPYNTQWSIAELFNKAIEVLRETDLIELENDRYHLTYYFHTLSTRETEVVIAKAVQHLDLPRSNFGHDRASHVRKAEQPLQRTAARPLIYISILLIALFLAGQYYGKDFIRSTEPPYEIDESEMVSEVMKWMKNLEGRWEMVSPHTGELSGSGPFKGGVIVWVIDGMSVSVIDTLTQTIHRHSFIIDWTRSRDALPLISIDELGITGQLFETDSTLILRTEHSTGQSIDLIKQP